MRITRWVEIGLCGLLGGLGACGGVEESDDEIGSSDSSLIVLDEAHLWPLGLIPMCWQWDQGFSSPADAQAAKDFVRATIEEGWVAPTRLWVFWVDCPTEGDQTNVRVTLQSGSSGYSGNVLGGFGTNALTTPTQRKDDTQSMGPGLRLFIQSNWNSNDTERALMRSLILHEFGHILGFGHERRHPGGNPLTEPCYGTESGATSDLVLGPPDPASIMGWSYCFTTSNGQLSATDVANVRQLYGTVNTRFSSNEKWSDGFCVDGEECRLGDVDGDGKDDIVAFGRSSLGGAAVWVGRAGTLPGLPGWAFFFHAPAWWSGMSCQAPMTCEVADVNADGRDDLVMLTRGAAHRAVVALSNGTSFGPSTIWNSTVCFDGEVCKLADVNGDGADDIVVFKHDAVGEVWVLPAVRNLLHMFAGFGAPEKWIGAGFCGPTETCEVGDVNGDGKADAVAFTRGGNARTLLARSTGSIFTAPVEAGTGICLTGQECRVVDVDGDSLADLVAFEHDAGPEVQVQRAYRGALAQFTSSRQWSPGFCAPGETCMLGDVTGDGAADAVVATRGIGADVFVQRGVP